MTDIRELLRRLQLGEPDRRIARDLSLSRNTVARYRQWATEQKLLPGALPEPAALAALLQPAAAERPAHEQSLVEPGGQVLRRTGFGVHVAARTQRADKQLDGDQLARRDVDDDIEEDEDRE